MTKKYYVVATKWFGDFENGKQAKYIAGEFSEYYNARLFCKAYNEHFSANAIVIDEFAMINTNVMTAKEV